MSGPGRLADADELPGLAAMGGGNGGGGGGNGGNGSGGGAGGSGDGDGGGGSDDGGDGSSGGGPGSDPPGGEGSPPGGGPAGSPPRDLPELLTFPTDFPIKVMGKRVDGFADTIAQVVLAHAPDFDVGSMELRASSKGNYIGLTVTIRATSREQLDALYRALSAHPMVSVVL